MRHKIAHMGRKQKGSEGGHHEEIPRSIVANESGFSTLSPKTLIIFKTRKMLVMRFVLVTVWDPATL